MPDWHLLTSDEAGTIREHRTLYAQGMTFGGLRPLGEMAPLPEGATLCFLPGRVAMGVDRQGRTAPAQANPKPRPVPPACWPVTCPATRRSPTSPSSLRPTGPAP